MQNPTLKRTPLYDNHIQLKARMVPFADYEMPVQYQGVLEETKGCRSKVGLFDVSHMGQFSIRGASALEEVQKLVTNDLSKIQIGQAQYNMLCNENGGVIDDLVVYRRSLDHIYICVNASNRETDRQWFQSRLASTVFFEDESDSTALIAVQGPSAEALISTISDGSQINTLKYYWAMDGLVAGIPCYISRTGYTGEDGFELYVASSKASDLWNALLDHGKSYSLTPCGLGARDTLRLEMGYPLHGHELSTGITPLQAGLSWVVKLQKSPHFIGQTSLQQHAKEGPTPVLRAYRVQDRRIARQGYRVFDEQGTQVGQITSGTHSPHLEAPIALALVDKKVAEEAQLWVEVRQTKIPMEKTKLPFVQPHTKKL
jgi:aminomethyltransferase